MMEFTAEMIAGFLGGEIVGNKEAKVHTVSSIEEGKAGSLSYLTNPKYEAYIYTTGASVVLVNRTFEPAQPLSATLIKVDDAGACVLKLLEMYNAAKPRRSGISPLASVCAEAQVGEGCYIGDFAVVEAGVKIGNGCQIYPQVYLGTGVSVGEGTILYPGVKVYEGCLIGRNCILHAGAVIGAAHSCDVPYVFGTLDAPGSVAANGADAPQALSDEMHAAWVRFAKTGNPGWAAFETGKRFTRLFDEEVRTHSDPWAFERRAMKLD